jgi:hypothetical protein
VDSTSSRGVFDHLSRTQAGKIPAGIVPENFYADCVYHAMMMYLDLGKTSNYRPSWQAT